MSSLSSLAYRSGITSAVVAPLSGGFLRGLSAAFSTGARHKLDAGALVQSGSALHVSIHPVGTPSVSTQVAALRHLLLNQSENEGELGKVIGNIRKVGGSR